MRLLNWKLFLESNNVDNVDNYDGSIDLGKKGLLKIPKKWNIVTGDFKIFFNKLKNLKGSPNEVHGNFFCGNNELVSLEGSPKKVLRGFYCAGNKLKSLEGISEFIGDNLFCQENELKTLKGSPKKIGGNFYCWGNKLKTLEGIPDCKGVILVYSNQLISLKGSPKYSLQFDCSYNKLRTLEYSPEIIGRETTNKIGYYFSCRNNELISLVGGPKIVYGDYIFESNNIKELTDFPFGFTGKVYYLDNPVAEILKLFGRNGTRLGKEIEYLNEFRVIKGNKIFKERLKFILEILNKRIPAHFNFKNYEIFNIDEEKLNSIKKEYEMEIKDILIDWCVNYNIDLILETDGSDESFFLKVSPKVPEDADLIVVDKDIIDSFKRVIYFIENELNLKYMESFYFEKQEYIYLKKNILKSIGKSVTKFSIHFSNLNI